MRVWTQRSTSRSGSEAVGTQERGGGGAQGEVVGGTSCPTSLPRLAFTGLSALPGGSLRAGPILRIPTQQ